MPEDALMEWSAGIWEGTRSSAGIHVIPWEVSNAACANVVAGTLSAVTLAPGLLELPNINASVNIFSLRISSPWVMLSSSCRLSLELIAADTAGDCTFRSSTGVEDESEMFKLVGDSWDRSAQLLVGTGVCKGAAEASSNARSNPRKDEEFVLRDADESPLCWNNWCTTGKSAAASCRIARTVAWDETVICARLLLFLHLLPRVPAFICMVPKRAVAASRMREASSR